MSVDDEIAAAQAKGETVGWIATCPACGFAAPLQRFNPSAADECECPKCEAGFEFHPGDDEDEDDD